MRESRYKVDVQGSPVEVKLDNKNSFLLLARLILIFLDTLTEHPGSPDEAFEDALSGKI
jgi:hypothetical protein